MSTLSRASPSSSSRHGRTYDVFLSFRGEDTRKQFIDHLYVALAHAGIRSFRDDDELSRGEEISPALSYAIRESKISLVVFSKNYASSRWCLDELVTILERRKMGQIVVPVFYDIDPSDVRKQTGSYADAFARHGERFNGETDRVIKWRGALTEAANLSGWSLKDVANGYESELIRRIVGDILVKLSHNYFHFPNQTVGIDSRVEDIIKSLTVVTEDVRIVGLHGMSGCGKTTLAKAVFNKLYHGFGKRCFLFNVKEMSQQPNGRVRLQEEFLRRVFKLGEFKQIDDVDKGMNMIKERLWDQRVLAVLDDVDQPEQLHELVEVRSWFGPGSIVIITTGNEHLLTQLEVNVKYRVAKLSHAESLELFSRHAFRDTQPIEDYAMLSNDVLSYCGGHPLALELLGSFLFKREKPEWESLIDSLKKITPDQIQQKLRISFEALGGGPVKSIFLDIACFFVGRDKEYVKTILDARYGFNTEIAIKNLIERSFITIDSKKEINLNNLLRDMGREINREMSPDHPGNRSRICFHDDALDVLYNKKGTKSVQGLALDVRFSKSETLSSESFMKMRCLKLLQINGVYVTGCFQHLSKELLWLCWHECPLRSLPSDFHLQDIVILDFQNSNIEELWKEIKFLNKLKILDLSYSKFLSRTPNLHSPSLEKLILEGCSSLVELHQSIGRSKGLVYLNLRGCCRLKNLPESICELEFLETLNITMCSQLEKLPKHIGNMECLRGLLADGTSIKQLPLSIVFFKKLEKLSLCGRNYDKLDSPSGPWHLPFSSWFSPRNTDSKTLLPVSFGCLMSLRELDISYHGLSEGSISVAFESLSALRRLDLSGNKFLYMPFGIGGIPKLEILLVVNCKNLQSIAELPSSLLLLDATNCTSMESLAVPSNKCALKLRGCQKLREIHGIEGGSDCTSVVHMECCNNLSNNFKRSLVQALCKGKRDEIFFPADEIPEWFSHHGDGSSLSFLLPALSFGDELLAMIVWVVFAVDERRFLNLYPSAIIRNKSNGKKLVERSMHIGFISSSHSWVSHAPFVVLPCAMEGGGELELNVEVEEDAIVEKCGVHLVVKRADLRDGQGTFHENLEAAIVEKPDEVATVKRGQDYNHDERSLKRLKPLCRTSSSNWVVTSEEII